MSRRTKLGSHLGLVENWMQVTAGSPFNLTDTGGAIVEVWQPSLQNWVSTAPLYSLCPLYPWLFNLLFLCFYTPVVFFSCTITAFLVSCSQSFLGGGSDVFGWLHSIMEPLPGKLLIPGLLVASAHIRLIIGGPIRGSQADRQLIPGELTECCSEGAWGWDKHRGLFCGLFTVIFQTFHIFTGGSVLVFLLLCNKLLHG